jgi:carboxyl-terminal processing protease
MKLPLILLILLLSNNLVAKNPDLIVNQKEINRFIDVLKIIKKNYIYEIDDKKAIDDALGGLLSGLDPHSVYYSKDAYLDVLDRVSGEYGGLGIDISVIDGKLRVIKIIKDSPSELAGLKLDDNIIEINGKNIFGMTLSNIKSMIKGDVGTFVDLKVIREEFDDNSFANSKILDFKIERKIVKIENIEYKNFKNDVLYLKINNFSDSSYKDIFDVLKNNSSMRGMILDVRDNGGGLLDQAIKISDGFLYSGEIVSIKYKDSSSGIKKYNVSGSSFINKNIPVVLLINNYSASSSEILAGALKDNKRAILVGKTTFGKGSVQNIIPLKDGDAVKVTTALFYTPNDLMIQGNGVTPDIDIDDLIIKDLRNSGTGEVKNENELEKVANNQTIVNENPDVIDGEDRIDDLQLYIGKQILGFEMSKVKR